MLWFWIVRPFLPVANLDASPASQLVISLKLSHPDIDPVVRIHNYVSYDNDRAEQRVTIDLYDDPNAVLPDETATEVQAAWTRIHPGSVSSGYPHDWECGASSQTTTKSKFGAYRAAARALAAYSTVKQPGARPIRDLPLQDGVTIGNGGTLSGIHCFTFSAVRVAQQTQSETTLMPSQIVIATTGRETKTPFVNQATFDVDTSLSVPSAWTRVDGQSDLLSSTSQNGVSGNVDARFPFNAALDARAFSFINGDRRATDELWLSIASLLVGSFAGIGIERGTAFASENHRRPRRRRTRDRRL